MLYYKYFIWQFVLFFVVTMSRSHEVTFLLYILKKTPRNPLRRIERGLIYEFIMDFYIIPPIPPIPGPPAGIGGSSSGSSTRTHSVVKNIPAIEAAFSSAILATFVGSITPA